MAPNPFQTPLKKPAAASPRQASSVAKGSILKAKVAAHRTPVKRQFYVRGQDGEEFSEPVWQSRHRARIAVRDQWCADHLDRAVAQLGQEAPKRKLRSLARKLFTSLEGEAKATAFRQLKGVVKGSGPKQACDELAREVDVDEGEQAVSRLDHKAVMLTWNGRWGVLAEAGEIHSNRSEEALVLHVQGLDSAQALWQEFQDHASRLKSSLGAQFQSCCLEISLETWNKTGVLRVHAHAFLCNKARKLRKKAMGAIDFKDSNPVLSNFDTKASGRKRYRLPSDSGDFYVQAEKRGQLWSAGDRVLFTQVDVNGDWVTKLYAQGKISFSVCRTYYGRVLKMCSRNLQELEKSRELESKTLVAQLQAATWKLLDGMRKPSKRLPVVDAWVAEHAKVEFRYKFLVLEGPSCVGKSQFAASLVGREATLDLTCAGQTHPDLRQHSPLKHRCIIFDEAPVSMVLAYKRHFQAPALSLHMGGSATNQFNYEVYLHQQLLVITSNTWTNDLEKVDKDDREWIRINSVHVLCKEPLWIEEAEDPGVSDDIPDFAAEGAACLPLEVQYDEDPFGHGCSLDEC